MKQLGISIFAMLVIASTGAESAPQTTSLQQTIDDVDDLREWGYIGDGVSRPLSTVTIFGSLNTTGWTLAQWQTQLPAANALSNELDWAALQSMINAATAPVSIRFPSNSSNPKFDQPITVCNQSVAFHGVDSGTDSGNPAGTKLEFTSGTNGLVHCNSATSKIEAYDIQLYSDVTNGTGTGIYDLRANYTYLNNVSFNGFNGGCGNFTNPAATTLNRVRCFDSQPAGTSGIGDGLVFQGQYTFINHITDTVVQGYSTCYHWNSTNSQPAIGIEDTQVVNSACGGGRTGIAITSNDPTYGPFNYSFLNMSVDVTTAFIFAPNFNDLIVTGGNWLFDVPVGAWSAGTNMIDLATGTTNTHMARLDNMYFQNPTHTNIKINSLVTAESGMSDLQMIGNHIDDNSLTPANGWYQLAPGANHVIEDKTSWANLFTSTSPPANAVVYNGNTDASNKLHSTGEGIPYLANCDSNFSLAPGSDNTEGTILEGSGSPGGCTLNFGQPFRANTPDVELFNTQGAHPLTLTTLNNTGFIFTHDAGSMTVHYHARPY